MDMSLRYSLKNVGHSPAVEVDSVDYLITDNTVAEPPADLMKGLCGSLENTVIGHNSTIPDSGNVIFPDARTGEIAHYLSLMEVPSNVKTIRGVWVGVCVVYRDSFGLHHSKFWFRSNQPDFSQTTLAVQGSDLRWSPFNGLVLWSAEAD
jgi:hypothetical protein